MESGLYSTKQPKEIEKVHISLCLCVVQIIIWCMLFVSAMFSKGDNFVFSCVLSWTMKPFKNRVFSLRVDPKWDWGQK